MNKSVDALVEDPDIIGTYVSTHCYKPPFSVQKFNQVNLNFSNHLSSQILGQILDFWHENSNMSNN